MIAVALTLWAVALFVLVRRAEHTGHDGTETYHHRDFLAERLGWVAWRLGLGAVVLALVASIMLAIAGAHADGASAALDLCRELGVTAWDEETTRACLGYADSAAGGGSVAGVATTMLWLALVL